MRALCHKLFSVLPACAEGGSEAARISGQDSGSEEGAPTSSFFSGLSMQSATVTTQALDLDPKLYPLFLFLHQALKSRRCVHHLGRHAFSAILCARFYLC